MIYSDIVTLLLYIWAATIFEKTVCSPEVSKSTCPSKESASVKTASGYTFVISKQGST